MSWPVRAVVFVACAGLVPVVVGARQSVTEHNDGPVKVTGPVVATTVIAHDPRGVVGIGGCLGGGCHGGPASASLAGADVSRWTCSATHWLAADPHTRAYAALEGELAARIVDRLGNRDAAGHPVPATEIARCLACHTTPTLASDGAPTAGVRALREQGVSCEACHGSAGGWLREHTGWTAATRPGGYATSGMVPLYDLGERAVACAGCHVGAPADPRRGYPVRDVTHDMIAAGHPRLNFDFADYQHRLPAHWIERDRTRDGSPTRDPDFEVQTWLIGRVAHAETACRLLADRAGRSDAAVDPAPWPEFAEFSCVSCHRTLAGQVTGHAARDGRRPGTPAWQPIWPVTRPDDFDRLPGRAPGVAERVNDLRAVMQRSQPSPDTTRAAAVAASTALAALRAELVGVEGSRVRSVVKELLATATARQPSPDLDRDLASQLFHGLAAAERARVRWGGKPDFAAFDRVRNRLTLPRGTLRFDAPDGIGDDLKDLLK